MPLPKFDLSPLGRFARRPLTAILAFLRTHATLLGACALVACVQLAGALTPLDNALSELRAEMVQRDPSGSIVVVEIDSQSVRAAGQWPWPRERFASAIRNLSRSGAALIGFDVDFSERSNTADDSALRAAIEADPGSVVLPTFVQSESGEENAPLASLSRDAVVGSVNVRLDEDGRVRRYLRGFDHGDHYHASIAAVLADEPYGLTSAFLIDYGINSEHIDRLSFEDVYRGAFDPARVRGKVVLVGATALELGDEFVTPAQTSTPGVVVHALAYESLVQGRALLEPSRVLVLGLALLVLVMLWPRRGPLDLQQFFVRQGAVLSASLLAPFALQAAAPVSADLGLVLLAQALCVVMSIHRELARRTAELVQQREAHLSFVALHDPETDLPNRRAMIEELLRHLAANEQGGEGVVVAMAVGIERFPVLRSAIGYANANKAVRSLSLRVRECGDHAQVFHISTSVLGVVMTVSSEEGARFTRGEGLETLDTSVLLDGQQIELVVRAGSSIAAAGATAERLLEQATIALDQARLKGRRHVNYDAEHAADPQVQLALMSDIGRGLARGEFTLVYQAKASTDLRALVGAEALMRWRHPVHGIISPDQFVTAAEETGAIDALTRWSLQQAIADQNVLRAMGVEKTFSVNLSGRSLSSSEFCDFAIAATKKCDANLCFEITETGIISDPIAAMASISAYRAAGIKISIDDYGSGLSSLAYLKQLMADELKLDKSLIRDIKTSSRDRLILKSTIDLAHGLGMSVVAEGVEDEASCALLTAMGCDSIQGYLVSHPVSLAEFASLCGAVEGAAAVPVRA